MADKQLSEASSYHTGCEDSRSLSRSLSRTRASRTATCAVQRGVLASPQAACHHKAFHGGLRAAAASGVAFITLV